MKLNNGKKLPTKREYNRLTEQLQKGSKRMKAFGAKPVTGEKKELSPYIRFYTMRIKQMFQDKRPVQEKMKDIVLEWKALTDDQKKNFDLIPKVMGAMPLNPEDSKA